MNASIVIEARNLTKAFRGGIVAVSGLDLAVPRGSVYGLIGRNGAGKTTTLRLLMGLLRPDQGEAKVFGASLWNAPHKLRQRVAYVSQSQQLPGWMTLDELSRSNASFYPRWDPDLARVLARRWELPLKRPIAHLSGGEQRQSSILLALATRPEVLFLDEPAAGLDPIARRELLASLVDSLSWQDGCTIMFSTHYIGDLERIAEHVAMMDRGRITRSLRLDEWLQSTKRVQVVFDGDSVPPEFTIPGTRRSRSEGPVFTALVELSNEDQLNHVRALRGTRVNIFAMNLEEIFIDLFERPSESEPSQWAELSTQENPTVL